MILDLKCNCYRKLWLMISAVWYKAFAFSAYVHRYQFLPNSPIFLPLPIFRMEPKSSADVEDSVGNVFLTWLLVSQFKSYEHSEMGSMRRYSLEYLQLTGAHFWTPPFLGFPCPKWLCFFFFRVLIRESNHCLLFPKPSK